MDWRENVIYNFEGRESWLFGILFDSLYHTNFVWDESEFKKCSESQRVSMDLLDQFGVI